MHHAGVAWAAAVAGAWLVGGQLPHDARRAAARARPRRRSAAPPRRADAAVRRGAVAARRGAGVEQASIAARSAGVRVHGAAAGENVAAAARAAARDVRARRRHAAGCGCARRGTSSSARSSSPPEPAELLPPTRRPTAASSRCCRPRTARLTVVNVVDLEDYLRGVVPNELAPEAFPQIEAQKAQAVAARSYALAHLGDYSSRGLRRLRHGGLPGLPRRRLGAPAHRPRGGRDAGDRGDLARPADPRLLHVDLRRPHRGGHGGLRGRGALPARRRLPDRARRSPTRARPRAGLGGAPAPGRRGATRGPLRERRPRAGPGADPGRRLRPRGGAARRRQRGRARRCADSACGSGCGLRESLFVLHRETARRRRGERFVSPGTAGATAWACARSAPPAWPGPGPRSRRSSSTTTRASPSPLGECASAAVAAAAVPSVLTPGRHGLLESSSRSADQR